MLLRNHYFYFVLHIGTNKNVSTHLPCSIGDLPTADDNPMATLHWAKSTHLAKLDRQRIAIGTKYDAIHNLLVKAQTDFDISAIK